MDIRAVDSVLDSWSTIAPPELVGAYIMFLTPLIQLARMHKAYRVFIKEFVIEINTVNSKNEDFHFHAKRKS